MPSLYARMMNLVFRCMPQDKPGQPHDYAAERKRNDRKPPRPPKGVTVRLGKLDGLSAEFIQKNGNHKGTIFYIHGGGFTVGSARERRAVCQYITANYGYNCVTFNYRLAPENLWPAPLEDCLTAYAALLKTGVSPKDVVFMGGKRRRHFGAVLGAAAEGKGASPTKGTGGSLSLCDAG